MDLNELLSRHQRALMSAGPARPNVDRGTQFDLVEHYAKRIQEYRADLGFSRHSSIVTPIPVNPGAIAGKDVA
jgi:hypothetical protein